MCTNMEAGVPRVGRVPRTVTPRCRPAQRSTILKERERGNHVRGPQEGDRTLQEEQSGSGCPVRSHQSVRARQGDSRWKINEVLDHNSCCLWCSNVHGPFQVRLVCQ
jgi:hypothetical protein